MKHQAFARADRVAHLRLGMAECGWRGLSEGWLMRHLGDVHWGLIAQAMGQTVAVFEDDEGAPVYAAFCATDVQISQPELARPGAGLTIRSRLRRLTATRLISVHSLAVGGLDFGAVTMISTFVRHDASGRNAQIRKVQPKGALTLPMMEAGADAGLVAEALRLSRDGSEEGPGLTTDVTPCPTTDFNAAGLLYCASYPSLADRAEWSLARDLAGGFLKSRRIVFLGNVDPAETVSACLERSAADPARHRITLHSAGRPLARILTEKTA